MSDKILVNVVKWKEEGAELFVHTGRTFEVDPEDLGLVDKRSDEVRIASKYPLVITESNFVTSDGRSIRNIAIEHKLIGLISDYYIFNESHEKRAKD
jgi:hypothetical protein